MRPLNRTNLAREISRRDDLVSFLKSKTSINSLFDFAIKLSPERVSLYKNLYQGIGNTPVASCELPNDNILHVKLEYENSLGNSHYSRYWIPYLFLAEELGIIKPNESKLLEVTSGSSGIALSEAAKYLGYDVTLIVPASLPNGRLLPMEAAGAKLIRVNGYIDACIEQLGVLLKKDEFYYPPNHSDEKFNLIIHIFSRIATEYIGEFGKCDYIILGLGNGTSTEAIAQEFKNLDPTSLIYSYYPSFDKNQIIFGLLAPNIHLKHVGPALSLTDHIVHTNDIDLNQDLFDMQLKDLSGMGMTTRYGLSLALKLSHFINNKKIFCIAYDKIERYME